MKKTISILFASLLVLAVIGQANAEYSLSNLTQVMYTNDTSTAPKTLLSEVATELTSLDLTSWSFSDQEGTAQTLYSSSYGTNLNTYTGAINSMDWLTGGDSSLIDTTYVAYYGVDQANGVAFIATTSQTGQEFASGAPAGQTVSGKMYITENYYNGQTTFEEGTTTSIASATNLASYQGNLNDAGNTPGGYLGYVTGDTGVQCLSGLGTIDDEDLGSVEMYLYMIDLTTGELAATGTSTDYVAVITLEESLVTESFFGGYITGDVTMLTTTITNMGEVSTAVPVPGAVVLFGSALLGLFGIRRKNA